LRGSGGAAGTALLGSARLRWLAIIIAVMAVLTAGWPLLNRAVSDHRRLAPNTRLAIGPSHKNGAIVTLGPGWTMRAGETNPRLVYTLQRGPLILSITYATLINNRQIDDLWAGLREVVQVGHPGATLSVPVSVRTIHGSAGDIGLVKAPDLVGTASVFAGPSRRYAIEMIVAEPKGAARLNLVAAQRIMRSLIFPSGAAAKVRR
jgi:hypothetical protein